MNTRFITLGTFVVVTLGAFTWLAMQLGLGDRNGTHYTVKTQDAAGLVEGNSVRIAGVEVGKVEQIHVEGNVAVIDIRVRPGTNVWSEACAAVHIKGMLGEKYLGISQAMEGTPMPAKSTFGCVTATVDFDNALNATKEMVYGEDSLLPPITRVAHRIDRLTASLDEGPGLPREKLEKMLDDTRELLATARDMLKDNREDLRGIAEGANTMLHDPRISRIIGNTDKLVATLGREVPDMLAKGDRLLTRLDKASELFSDDNLAKFDRILSNGDTAAANLSKISGDFKDIGKELKPALVKVGPMLKNLATLAERGAAITFSDVKRFFQVEGMRVRIVKNRKAEREIGEDQDEAEGFQGP
jgi:phospholipid/cholesterol/gamma-HCH transport system substrate-binding protein